MPAENGDPPQIDAAVQDEAQNMHENISRHEHKNSLMSNFNRPVGSCLAMALRSLHLSKLQCAVLLLLGAPPVLLLDCKSRTSFYNIHMRYTSEKYVHICAYHITNIL